MCKTCHKLESVTRCNISIGNTPQAQASSKFFFADDVRLFFSTGGVGIFVAALVPLLLDAEVHAVEEINEQACKTTKRFATV